ncbi:uncharacterized protein LOC17894239 [Capsella rubella]|uniref:uncharacterized protein LOC17894239 n=1 Tax=Capsella rubella TaxID=81985 RepID=UPI000CD59B1C|nr:uncharacterized protein LOC17894239 [Capsella rubella]
MVATATILKITPFHRNPSFPYKQRPNNVYFYSKPQLLSIRLQIAVKYKQSPWFEAQVRSDTDSNHDQLLKKTLCKILVQIKKTLDSLKKPVSAAVFMLSLILLCDRNLALAASGGRIGGSAFSSRSNTSSSSSTSSSRSLSSSSSSSYSFDFESRLSSQFSVLSSRVMTLPLISNTSLSLIMIGLTAFGIVSVTIANMSESDNISNTQKTSVLRLQVGLLGSARNLQQDFNHLAENADTTTPEGLSYVLTEATLALLRHPDYCISCYSSVDLKQCLEEGEKQFNQLSVEERGKFDEETLVNVNNIKIRSSKIQKASGLSNEYIVVTMLVAVEGTYKLQTIKRSEDLKEALHKLGSIPSSKILAVEVLWTPQNEKDVLTERELLEDYPLLRPL